MGRFKLTLPWQGDTVIGQVVTTLAQAGIADIVVITGHRTDEIEAALAGRPVQCVFNPEYAGGEMLSSIRAGLTALGPQPAAALLCLGDQPQMEEATVRAILAEGERTNWEDIIIPSYKMRAGHPILLPRSLWDEVRGAQGALRDVLRGHPERVRYLMINTPSILADLDTPTDYEQAATHQTEE